MKKLLMTGTAVALAIGGMTSLSAQDDGAAETEGTEAVEEGNGAIVTRENIEEERVVLDEEGNPVFVQAVGEDGAGIVDEEGNPVFVQVVDGDGKLVEDADGNPVYQTVTETVTIGFTQTVETPSGNVHTITKEDGSRAIVTHERPEKAERADKAEKPDRPDKPERPDKPDKPDRPDKPDKPDRPGKPG
jgi:hypothetical protein